MYSKLLIKHALLKYSKLKPKLKKFLFFHLDRAIKYSAFTLEKEQTQMYCPRCSETDS